MPAQKNSAGFFRLLSNATIHGNSPRLKFLPRMMYPAFCAGFPQTPSTFLCCATVAFKSKTLSMTKSREQKLRYKRISIFTPQNSIIKRICTNKMIRLALILESTRLTVKSKLKLLLSAAYFEFFLSNLRKLIVEPQIIFYNFNQSRKKNKSGGDGSIRCSSENETN